MLLILNVTHDDLDGNAAGACIRLAHPQDHVVTKPASTYGIARVLYTELLSPRRTYNRIILSDCSIKVPGDRCSHEPEYVRDLRSKSEDPDYLSEWDLINTDLPQLIRSFVQGGGEFVVLDHHETALNMQTYYHDVLHQDSILEVTDEAGIKRAGSELAYRYYLNYQPENIRCRDLMTLCGDLDCWRNPTGLAADLGLACELMGDAWTMVEQLTQVINSPAETLEQAIYSSNQLKTYIAKAKKQLAQAILVAKQSQQDYPNNISVVESGMFATLVSLSIYTESKGIVVLTYPNKSKLSLRAHESNQHINLAAFAKKYGGGGHQFASGLKIPTGMTLTDIILELVKHADNQNK